MDKLLALTLPGYDPINAPGNVPTGGLTTGENSLESILGNALGIMVGIGVVIVLVFITLGGVQWVTSQGDKQKIQAARSRIMYAIIGLVVMFLAVFLINVVLQALGYKMLGT